jgi:hypothetical protein
VAHTVWQKTRDTYCGPILSSCYSAPAESICMHVLETDQTTIWLRDKALGHGSQRANVTFCWSDPLKARCRHNSSHNPFLFFPRFAGITYVQCRCGSTDHQIQPTHGTVCNKRDATSTYGDTGSTAAFRLQCDLVLNTTFTIKINIKNK